MDFCLDETYESNEDIDHRMSKKFEIVKEEVMRLLGDDDTGHDYGHCMIVHYHAKKAIESDKSIVNPWIKWAIEIAAVLHEVDDQKLFKTENYSNAREILEKCEFPKEYIELIIEMIDLVSCSKNRNSVVFPTWKLIPRWADRLEAIGNIGIKRTIIYSLEQKRPYFLEDTPRATTEEELWRISPKERFENYKGNSKSVIDHLYDKPLHLCIETGNSYIDPIMKERQKKIVEYCLFFGRNGYLDPSITL